MQDFSLKIVKLTWTSSSRVAAHRGFGFVVFSTDEEAEDAIDNMHLNEIQGVSPSIEIRCRSETELSCGLTENYQRQPRETTQGDDGIQQTGLAG